MADKKYGFAELEIITKGGESTKIITSCKLAFDIVKNQKERGVYIAEDSTETIAINYEEICLVRAAALKGGLLSLGYAEKAEIHKPKAGEYLCISDFEVPDIDDEGRPKETKSRIIKGSIWNMSNEEYRFCAGKDSIRLECDERWIEITPEHFEECFVEYERQDYGRA